MAWGNGGSRLGRCDLGPLALLAGAVLAFTAITVLWPFLSAPDVYTEPIVGAGTWSGAGKAADLRAAPFLVLLGVLGAIASGLVLGRLLGERPDPQRREAVRIVVFLALVPAAGWAAAAFVRPRPAGSPLFAGCFLAVGLAVVFVLGRFAPSISAEAIGRLGSAGILVALLSFFSGLGVSVSLFRLAPLPPAATMLLSGLPWLGLVAGVGAVAALVSRAGSIEALETRLPRLVALAHAPLALLYFGVLPPPVQGPHGGFREASWIFVLVVTAAALATSALWARRWIGLGTGASPPSWWRSCLFPASLAAIPVFLAAPEYGVPAVPTDWWHSGEHLLPWHQWVRFGSLPWVDLNPARGLWSLAAGALNGGFLDGTTASLPAADGILASLAAAATFGLAWRVFGPVPAFASVLVVLEIGQLLFFLPAVLALSLPLLLNRAAIWLPAWFLISVLATAYNPTSGIALALGSLPLALYVVSRGAREARAKTAAAAGITAAVAALVALVTPAGRIAAGFGRFFLDNLGGYVQTAGLAAAIHWTASPSDAAPVASLFGLEVLRFGWIPGVVVLAAVALREGAVERELRRVEGLAVAATVALAALVLSRWSMVRIDGDSWSRTGTVTFVVVCQVLPLLLLFRASRARAAATVLVLAAVVGMLGRSSLLSEGAEPLVRKALGPRRLAPDAVLASDALPGLHYLGRSTVGPRATASLRSFHDAVARYLRPGETFFDLADQNALYIFEDRRVPAPYSAGYYAGTRLLQKRILDALRRENVSMAVLAPAFGHDGGPASLRSHDLARVFLLEYSAVSQDPWTLLVRPERAPEAGPIGSEGQLEILDRAIGKKSSFLAAIPATWGRSWESMAGEFSEVTKVSVGPGGACDLSATGLRGQDADFLLLELSLTIAEEGTDAEMGIEWQASGQPRAGPVSFLLVPPALEREGPDPRRLESARYLVPLGSHPRWLLSGPLERMDLSVTGSRGVAGLELRSATLLRMRPLD